MSRSKPKGGSKHKQLQESSHTAWDCTFHIAFITKYRRRVLFAKLGEHLGPVFRKPAEQKESRVEEGKTISPPEASSKWVIDCVRVTVP